MPIQFGNNNIKLDGISEVYVGSNKVYSASVPGPPIIESPKDEYFCVWGDQDFKITISKNRASNYGNINWDPATNARVKYSTDKSSWSDFSYVSGNIDYFEQTFSANTLYYIYTVGMRRVSIYSNNGYYRDCGWGGAARGPYSDQDGHVEAIFQVDSIDTTKNTTVYLQGNLRTLANASSADGNTALGSNTQYTLVNYSINHQYYTDICYACNCGIGTGRTTAYGTTKYVFAGGIQYIRGVKYTANSTICYLDVSNLWLGAYNSSDISPNTIFPASTTSQNPLT